MARGGARPGAGAPKGDRNGKRKMKVSQIPPPGEVLPVAPKTRKAKAPAVVEVPELSEEIARDLLPLDHFLKVIRDPLESKDRRDRAAAVLLPFLHEKAGATKGKKEERDDAAKKAASGKFAVPSAPRLTVAK